MELCAPVESRLDEFCSELLLSDDTDPWNHVAPPVRCQHDIPQSGFSTDAFQPSKVTGIGPPPAFVRDSMKVDDPGEIHLVLIPAIWIS